jgi:hypothetical protein
MSALSIESRVATLIFTLWMINGGEGQPLSMTHGEIGKLVGGHRTSVTDAITSLTEAGAITSGRCQITITCPEALVLHASPWGQRCAYIRRRPS